MGQTTGHSNDPPRPEQDEELLWEQIAEKIDTLVAAWSKYSSKMANEPDLGGVGRQTPVHHPWGRNTVSLIFTLFPEVSRLQRQSR